MLKFLTVPQFSDFSFSTLKCCLLQSAAFKKSINTYMRKCLVETVTLGYCWKNSVQSAHFKMSHEGHIKPKQSKNVIHNDGLTDYLIMYVQILY